MPNWFRRTSPVREGESTIDGQMPSVTVIDFRSLSYTGTTWLNLLAGSHTDVFTLVLPQRVYAAMRGEIEPAELCVLHRDQCPFWPTALHQLRPDDNLYIQLAELAGTTHIVLNNPFVDPRGVDDLDHPAVEVRKVTIVRDPRATVASYLARNDATAEQAIDWLTTYAGLAEAPAGEASIRFRYEDVVADQLAFLDELGAFVGLSYAGDAARFWEHEHHPAGGNGGPFALIGRHDACVPAADPMIEERYKRACNDPHDVANPEKWREVLSTSDLALLADRSAAISEAWGYAL